MKLFVGNLDFNATEPELAELFSRHGAPDQVKIVMDKKTNRSKGFAFIVFENDVHAIKCIQDLNGTDFKGRPLAVKEA